MVYCIDSMNLNYNHLSATGGNQIFSCTFSTQQCIIFKRLYQIFIVEHHWKEEIRSFPLVTQVNPPLLSNLKRRSTIIARHVSENVRLESILYLRLVLIDQC